MSLDDVTSTPIFDELLREMAQRAEPDAPAPSPEEPASPKPPSPPPRRRHRAE
ncbi:hypothetical protein [Actinophytocola sediminis]